MMTSLVKLFLSRTSRTYGPRLWSPSRLQPGRVFESYSKNRSDGSGSASTNVWQAWKHRDGWRVLCSNHWFKMSSREGSRSTSFLWRFRIPINLPALNGADKRDESLGGIRSSAGKSESMETSSMQNSCSATERKVGVTMSNVKDIQLPNNAQWSVKRNRPPRLCPFGCSQDLPHVVLIPTEHCDSY